MLLLSDLFSASSAFLSLSYVIKNPSLNRVVEPPKNPVDRKTREGFSTNLIVHGVDANWADKSLSSCNMAARGFGGLRRAEQADKIAFIRLTYPHSI